MGNTRTEWRQFAGHGCAGREPPRRTNLPTGGKPQRLIPLSTTDPARAASHHFFWRLPTAERGEALPLWESVGANSPPRQGPALRALRGL